MDILVIKLGALGDVLRTTSILPGLKEKYSQCRITWVTRRNAGELLKNNGLIDKIVFDDEADEKLKNHRFERVISLDDDEAACRRARAAVAQNIVGAYLENDRLTYSASSRAWFDMGLISRLGKKAADELKKRNSKTYQQILAEMLGIRMSRPELKLDGANLAFKNNFLLKNRLGEGDMIIGLNTGAGGRWQLKALGEEKTIALAHLLMQTLKARVLILGGPEEAERNQRILSAASGVIDGGCHNSLLDFAALVDACRVIITSDSLAMNMAIALEKRVIAFFGPTSASEIDLYGRGAKITPPMPCLCCYKKQCDIHPHCMEQIDIREIVRLAGEMLSLSPRSEKDSIALQHRYEGAKL